MTGKLPDPENHAAKGFRPPQSWALRNRRGGTIERQWKAIGSIQCRTTTIRSNSSLKMWRGAERAPTRTATKTLPPRIVVAAKRNRNLSRQEISNTFYHYFLLYF